MTLRPLFPVVCFCTLAVTCRHASAASLSISLTQIDRANANGALGTIDLTQGGAALDWVNPVGTNLAGAEKNATTLLSFSMIGSFTAASYIDDGYTTTWTGGTAANPSGSDISGSRDTSNTIGLGFRLNFLAPSAGDFLVKYYTAANGPITNYSLTGFQDATQLGSKTAAANMGADSVDELVWSISITADSPGQSFDLNFTRTTAAGSGAMAVTAATVVAVPEPATASLAGVAALALGIVRRRSSL